MRCACGLACVPLATTQQFIRLTMLAVLLGPDQHAVWNAEIHCQCHIAGNCDGEVRRNQYEEHHGRQRATLS